jgi:YfiH family protein
MHFYNSFKFNNAGRILLKVIFKLLYLYIVNWIKHMIKSQIGGLELWRFEILKDIPDIIHGVTGRNGGVSTGKYASLNFSYKSGDQVENVRHNINILAKYLKIDDSKIYFPKQSHTTDIRIVDRNSDKSNLIDVDAMITKDTGICIGVLAADCVPVLLYDPGQKVVAAVHAGWRGTIGNIAGKTIELMRQHFNTDPSDIIGCIGPAIGKDNYQVGYDVASLFDSQFTADEEVLTWDLGYKTATLDLCQANKILMTRSGVKENYIEMAKICTFDHPRDFFSARRDSNHSGRFVSFIGLSEN